MAEETKIQVAPEEQTGEQAEPINPLEALGLLSPEEIQKAKEANKATPEVKQEQKAEETKPEKTEEVKTEGATSETEMKTEQKVETETRTKIKEWHEAVMDYIASHPSDTFMVVEDSDGKPQGVVPLDGVVTLKVDGEVIRKPFREIIADGQKLSYADKVVQEAAEQKKKVEEELKAYQEAIAYVATMPIWDDKEIAGAIKGMLKMPPDEPIETILAMVDMEAFKQFLSKRDAALIRVIQDTQAKYQEKIASLNQEYVQKTEEIGSAKAPTLFTLLGKDEAVALLLNKAFKELEAKGLLISDKGQLVEIAGEVLTPYLDGIANQLEKKLNDMIRESYIRDLKHEIEVLRSDPAFRKEVAEEYLKEIGKLESVKTGESSVSGELEPREKTNIDALMRETGLSVE